MTEDLSLSLLAYIIVISLFAIYAAFDGFDLGIGIIQWFAPHSKGRASLQAAISPIWNGHEVWLISSGGALFATFPTAYATLFSALYLPVILLLMSFIVRAISLEVRNTLPSDRWQRFWDIGFTAGSLFIPFIFGITIGNLMQGLELDNRKEYAGTLLGLINPYSLLVGIAGVCLCALHGAFFALVKTALSIHHAIAEKIPALFAVFVCIYSIVAALAYLSLPHIAHHMQSRPFFWIVGLINICAISSSFIWFSKKRYLLAFAASCGTVLSTIALFAITTFPFLIRSFVLPESQSITVFNAASSDLSIQIFLLYIAIGIPIVIVSSLFTHRVFKGPIHTENEGY
jgi:cytochrome d ubiquinol oxidase subunit II